MKLNKRQRQALERSARWKHRWKKPQPALPVVDLGDACVVCGVKNDVMVDGDTVTDAGCLPGHNRKVTFQLCLRCQRTADYTPAVLEKLRPAVLDPLVVRSGGGQNADLLAD